MAVLSHEIGLPKGPDCPKDAPDRYHKGVQKATRQSSQSASAADSAQLCLQKGESEGERGE